MDDDVALRLITAILDRTIRDYILALSGVWVEKRPPIVTKRSIEAWAHSEDAELISNGLDCPAALEMVRKKYARFCELAEDLMDSSEDTKFKCPLCGAEANIRKRKISYINRNGEKAVRTERTAKCSCGCEYRRKHAVSCELH